MKKLKNTAGAQLRLVWNLVSEFADQTLNLALWKIEIDLLVLSPALKGQYRLDVR